MAISAGTLKRLIDYFDKRFDVLIERASLQRNLNIPFCTQVFKYSGIYYNNGYEVYGGSVSVIGRDDWDGSGNHYTSNKPNELDDDLKWVLFCECFAMHLRHLDHTGHRYVQSFYPDA